MLALNPIEGKPGPYDAIYDFNDTQKFLRETVPVKERLRKNLSNVVFAELEISKISQAMAEITRINEDSSPEDVSSRLLYQQWLFKVFSLMKPLVERKLVGRAVFFPPKNGGDLVRAMFQKLGLITNPEDVVDYELKRVLMPDGRLMVGVNENRYPQGPFETAWIIDDCAASIISILTSAHLVREHYGVDKLVICVSTGTQRGILSLEKELRENFAFSQTTIFSGTRVFAMSDNYYLLRTPEEGFGKEVYYVGDMGKWAEPLSSELNNQAPWNAFR